VKVAGTIDSLAATRRGVRPVHVAWVSAVHGTLDWYRAAETA
jgi:hypothetical protein